jgi:hypothetical protein
MKKTIKLLSLSVLFIGLTLTSCKKKTTEVDDTVKEDDETSIFTEHSNDVTTSDNSADMSIDDAENVLSPTSLSGFKGTEVNAFAICGANVDTSAITSAKTITITYTGNSCDNLRSRSGSMVIKLVSGAKWRDAGAVISITYNNFKVTTLSNNKSTILNGTHQITNVSGGLVPRIGIAPNPTTIIRKIRGINMSITFDDNTVRSWSAARLRTWTGSAGIPTGLTITGDTTLNGVANTIVWGTNRAGKTFTTVVNTPVVVNSSCGWFSPVSGKKTHTINNRISSITFGTDANGNVASPTTCPNHYLLTWTSLTNVAKSYVGTY